MNLQQLQKWHRFRLDGRRLWDFIYGVIGAAVCTFIIICTLWIIFCINEKVFKDVFIFIADDMSDEDSGIFFIIVVVAVLTIKLAGRKWNKNEADYMGRIYNCIFDIPSVSGSIIGEIDADTGYQLLKTGKEDYFFKVIGQWENVQTAYGEGWIFKSNMLQTKEKILFDI